MFLPLGKNEETKQISVQNPKLFKRARALLIRVIIVIRSIMYMWNY